MGRRWNRDPVVKPYRSPYDAFDNSPIWRVDPDGDDDYYNKYGKWVGNDGVGNGIRIIGAETVEKFSQQLSKYGIEAIRSVSREVKVQDDAQVKAILKDIKVNTEATGVENKAYFILDTGDEPSLSIVRQRQVSGDTKKKSVNTYTKRVVITTEGKEIMFLYSESENKVVVGQVHGHENKKAVENTMHGTTINATSTAPKTSHNDEDAANEMGVPIHAVDYTGNVQRTVPGQEGSTTLNPGQQVLIESLEKSGGKP